MSKKCSSDLFDLIKSLSKAEKRYFKVFSSRHTIGDENNYIRLFDYLDQMSNYEESSVFEHFTGEAFLNKFSITKSRLFDNILRALDSFHSNNSIDAQLFRMLNSADILYDKGLYELSKKELVSAKKLAEKKHKLHILTQINAKFKRLAETYNYTTETNETLNDIASIDKALDNEIKYQNQLWHIKSRLFKLLNSKGQIRTSQDKEAFDSIVCELDNIGQLEIIHPETKYLENHIRSAYAFAILDEHTSLMFLLENHKLLQNNSELNQTNPSRYLAVVTNIIHINRKLKDFDSANLFLEDLKCFYDMQKDCNSEDFKIKYFSSLSSLELLIINDSGEYEKIDELADKIQQGLTIFQDSISPARHAYLCFQIGTAYFGKGDFRKSLKWTNEIIHNPKLDTKQDIAAFAHILAILIHFELKNDEILPYAMRNTLQFLKKRKRSFKVESLFLKYMHKLVRTTNYFDRLELFEEIENCINAISNDPLESVALEYIDFTTWLESKRKQCDYAQLKKQKYIDMKAA